MRRGVTLAFVVVVLAGCNTVLFPREALPDGTLVDGIWIGDPIDCATVDCAAITACAIERGIGPQDRDDIAASAVFTRPERLTDGTLVVYGGPVLAVVFDMADGTRRADYVIGYDDC